MNKQKFLKEIDKFDKENKLIYILDQSDFFEYTPVMTLEDFIEQYIAHSDFSNLAQIIQSSKLTFCYPFIRVGYYDDQYTEGDTRSELFSDKELNEAFLDLADYIEEHSDPDEASEEYQRTIEDIRL